MRAGVLETVAAAVVLLACGCAGGEIAARQRTDDTFAAARAAMVRDQIEARGIRDTKLLDVMRRVPRHLFMPPDVRALAYEDNPAPIGFGQTISQPYIVAYMTEALQVSSGHSVLEIGTGSGYQAAVLAELARQVYSIEIVPALAEGARRTLAETGHRNVQVRTGNGYLGWPERAPFDRVIVTAAPPELPRALVDQLATRRHHGGARGHASPGNAHRPENGRRHR